jgi:Ran GTPase-activating protein (RanGAP) involved in mRNA processing and transport
LALQLKDRGYTRVDLSDNQLGDHAVLAVRSLIRALPKLQWICLASNLIGTDGAQELAEELETNKVLEGLILGGGGAGADANFQGARPNLIGAAGCRALLESLQRNPNPPLASLSLCNTSLGAEAGKHIASYLENNRTLQHLDISCNPLSSEGICTLLPQCTHLRILSICDTGCRGELIHSQLCATLNRSKSMMHLSLAQNPLETRPFRRISKALASCESLVSLNLECTSMDTESVTVLADALLATPVQSLTELDLSNNQLNQVEAAAALAHTIAHTVLQVLRLNRNALGDAGVRELADGLDSSTCPGSVLQHLELGSCRIGTAGAGHLFSCLSRNETLSVLRIGDNFLDSTLDIALIERLTHITELNVHGNRLSHSSMNRAAQTCARNRQRARDEGTYVLRAKMNELLYQESKLDGTREHVAKDDMELSSRQNATDLAALELRQLRATEAEAQRTLHRQIEEEQEALEASRAELVQTKKELVDSKARYKKLREDLRQKLKDREQDLLNLQLQCSDLDEHFARRKREHPQEVERVKRQITMALADAERCGVKARQMRAQVEALKDKSLIDFSP